MQIGAYLPISDPNPPLEQNAKVRLTLPDQTYAYCPLRGDIRKNWNDTEKISMAPAQG